MGEDSEYFKEEFKDDGDEEDDDQDSLCNPEQGSMIQHHVIFNAPRYPFINGIPRSHTNSHSNTNNITHKNQQASPLPIPAPYPILPTVPAV
ncbi:hypothetical protein Pst134EB_027387 [Puccinia striiformis f. sp. tritici]|nr:hypothetical protein Pst134EB_027387 [Puccinia striiformis f. sp. tritici]